MRAKIRAELMTTFANKESNYNLVKFRGATPQTHLSAGGVVPTPPDALPL